MNWSDAMDLGLLKRENGELKKQIKAMNMTLEDIYHLAQRDLIDEDVKEIIRLSRKHAPAPVSAMDFAQSFNDRIDLINELESKRIDGLRVNEEWLKSQIELNNINKKESVTYNTFYGVPVFFDKNIETYEVVKRSE